MTLCRLCQIKTATKKNSHIFPHGLVKEAINIDGYNQRGYNQTFILQSNATPQVHFGREIIQEHIKDIKGATLGSQTDQSNDPLARNYIFCPGCEDAIGKIESEFIANVYKRLKNTKIANLPCDNKKNKTFTLTSYESKLLVLLSYSIFFRASITKFNHHCFEKDIEESIRLILLRCVIKTSSNIKKYIFDLDSTRLSFPVIALYLEYNKNLILQHRSSKPHLVWANQFIFLLYEKSNHIESASEPLFGLSDKISQKQYLSEIGFSQINICVISKNISEEVCHNVLNFQKNAQINFAKNEFNSLCQKNKHRNASIREVNTFVHHYSKIASAMLHQDPMYPIIEAYKETFKIKQ